MTNITFSEPQNTPLCHALFEVPGTTPRTAVVGRLTGAPGWIASTRALLRTTEPAVDVVAPLPGLSFWLLPCSELVAQSLRPPQGLRRRTRVGQQKVEKRDYAGLLQPPCEGVWFDRAFLGRSPAFERIDGPSVQS